METQPTDRLLRRVRALVCLFIVGLFMSGVTAIPIEREVGWLVNTTGARPQTPDSSNNTSARPAWAAWLCQIEDALKDTNRRYPFIAYGGDWLAFGHFMIALAFIGAWRDPVRNRWLFDFGLMACALVIPYAFIFGAMRGIPIWWRLIDCSFGIFGAIPLWICRRLAEELENRVRVTTSDGTLA